MADKDTTTTFGADITPLKKAMQEASRAVRLANAEFKAATAGMDNWSNTADGVTAKLKQLNSVHDAQVKKLDRLKIEYEQVSQKLGANSRGAKELEIQIKNQEAAIAKTDKEIRQYTTTLDEMTDETDDASDSSETLSSKLKDGLKGAAKAAATALMELGKQAVEFASSSVKVGMAFDSQMSTVKAIAGATEEEFAKLNEKAKEMGATTAFTATEAGQAFEYMAMAGWDTSQMLDGIDGVMNLAAASGENLATVSDIVTDALTAFKMPAEQAGYFADILAKTATSANTNVSMMGETFKYVAPLAGTLGYTAEDMAVAIGLMANNGIKAEQAGTSLRGLISNMAAPTDSVAGAMEKLNVTLTDTEGNAKPFRIVLDELRNSMSNLSEAEQTETAKLLAGKNAMSGFLALVNSSDEDFEKLAQNIKNSSGAAKEMAEIRLDNLQGDVTLFNSALDGVKLSLSEKLTPALRTMVQYATDKLPEIGEYVGDFGAELADVASGILPLLFDVLQELANPLKEIFGTIKNMAKPLGDAVKSLLPAFSKIISTISNTINTTVKNVLPPLLDMIEAAAPILNVIVDTLSPILEFITKIATTINGKLISAVSEVLRSFYGSNNILSETRKKFAELSEEEQNLIDETDELVKAQEANNKAVSDTAKAMNDTYDEYNDYISQLDNIVDANGRIKEGHEEEAEYIKNKLKEDLGYEIEIRDGIIQKYDEQKQSIEELITLKQAEATLSALSDEYNTAKMQRRELEIKAANAQNALTNRETEIENRQIALDTHSDDRIWGYHEAQGEYYVKNQTLYDEEIAAIQGLTDGLEELKNKKNEADEALRNNNQTISSIKKLEKAVAEKDIPSMITAMQNLESSFITCQYGTEQSLMQQAQTLHDTFFEMKQAASAEGSEITDAAVANAHTMYLRSIEEYAKLKGESISEVIKTIEGIEGLKEYAGNAGRGLAYELSEAFINAAAEQRYRIESAWANIMDGISSISSNVTINSASDFVYYSSKNLAGHAKGGIVTKEHIARVGEDGAEAIIPLEKNTGWISNLAKSVAGEMVNAPNYNNSNTANTNVVYNFNQTNNSPKSLSRLDIYRQSKKLLGMVR